MRKLPDINVIADVVINGINIMNQFNDLTANDAAQLVNKNKKSGLVNDYIREYITKSICARDNHFVELDSGGDRLGRVEKVIKIVAERLNFEKFEFVYKFKKDNKPEAEPIPEQVQNDDAIALLKDLVSRVARIESILNMSEIKILAYPNEDKLTDWKTMKKEIEENKKKEAG